MPLFCLTLGRFARNGHQFIHRKYPSQTLASTRGLKSSTVKSAPPSGDSSHLTDPENKGHRQVGINFDSVGSWNNRLEQSVNVEESIRHGKLIPQLDLATVGACTEIGRRAVNEDRFLVQQLKPSLYLFAVFDGHGSSVAVDYVHKRMVDHIMYHVDRNENSLQKILKDAFIEINNSFARYIHSNHLDDEQVVTSGTTATVCLLRSGIELVVGHVGDSRATLCREGRFVRLSHDQAPSQEREKQRIVSMGGRVVSSSLGKPRVNGRLDMSRSIGDLDLKPYGVTAEAETRSIEVRHGRDAFLVLTTDGIHSVLNSQEVTELINGCKDPHEAARFLLDQALMFGTEDNCTAVVIPFGAWGKFANTGNAIQFAISRNLSSRKYV